MFNLIDPFCRMRACRADTACAYFTRMSAHRTTSGRRPTNVTLPGALLREARELGINLSQACEVGLSAAVAGERRRRWLQDNGDALDEYNGYIERNGLPLAAYRQF